LFKELISILIYRGLYKAKELLITITIESKEVASSFIQQFELLWKLAKK